MFAMNKVRVLFFATLRDRAGARSVEIDLPVEATIRDLKGKLSDHYPGLRESMKAVLVTINREYAFDEASRRTPRLPCSPVSSEQFVKRLGRPGIMASPPSIPSLTPN
jgi:molybdopterin converting factor small subunit